MWVTSITVRGLGPQGGDGFSWLEAKAFVLGDNAVGGGGGEQGRQHLEAPAGAFSIL